MEKLNLFCPVNSLGYGVVGINLLKSLSQLLDVALFPIGNIDINNDNKELVSQAIGKGREFQDRNTAPCLKIWHEFALSERIGRGPYCAFPFFEINQLNDVRINHLASADNIIVASVWAQEILNQYKPLINKTSVIPLGVDTSIFNHTLPTVTDKCIFFNCGKWEKRKGHDILLEMFKQAFPTQTDVELWMLTSNPFLSEKASNEWLRYYSSDMRIRVFDRVSSQFAVSNLMSQSNCGIFPSRAEGWNLELLEMMAMGKHVIATNYSAHTEFCNDKNCNLINIKSLEKAEDGIFFDGSLGEWASLEGEPFDEGVEHMRSFYQKWQSDNTIMNEEGIKTATALSWTNTANKLEEVIYGNQSTEIVEDNTVAE